MSYVKNCRIFLKKKIPSKHLCRSQCLRNFSSSNLNGQLFHFQNAWPTNIKTAFINDMKLIQDFITEQEEQNLFDEAEKTLRRMRYEYDHWDNAIHGYREREKGDWSLENQQIFQRIHKEAFTANIIPDVHILDLASDGIIKPHVDSSRYCGSTIAGLSLLTDCIMRLKRIDENQYKQGKIGESTQQDLVDRRSDIAEQSLEFDYFVDILLKRRSLYVMKDSARYKFTHEVLPTNEAFLGEMIQKTRRISIICRNQA